MLETQQKFFFFKKKGLQVFFYPKFITSLFLTAFQIEVNMNKISAIQVKIGGKRRRALPPLPPFAHDTKSRVPGLRIAPPPAFCTRPEVTSAQAAVGPGRRGAIRGGLRPRRCRCCAEGERWRLLRSPRTVWYGLVPSQRLTEVKNSES